MWNIFLLFLCVFKGEGREQIMVFVCEERETIKKYLKFWYLNEIEYKIDNFNKWLVKNLK